MNEQRPTPAEVDEQVLRRLDSRPTLRSEIESFFMYVDSLKRKAETEPYKALTMAWSALDRVVKPIQEIVICKSGCSHCCNMATSVSSFDVRRIEKATGIKAAIVPEVDVELDDRTQKSEARKWMGQPCPFLKESKCSIYEARPSACRTHFNLADTNVICDLTIPEPADVPNIDWRYYWYIETLLVLKLGAQIADIRQFYPHVKEGEVHEADQ